MIITIKRQFVYFLKRILFWKFPYFFLSIIGSYWDPRFGRCLVHSFSNTVKCTKRRKVGGTALVKKKIGGADTGEEVNFHLTNSFPYCDQVWGCRADLLTLSHVPIVSVPGGRKQDFAGDNGPLCRALSATVGYCRVLSQVVEFRREGCRIQTLLPIEEASGVLIVGPGYRQLTCDILRSCLYVTEWGRRGQQKRYLGLVKMDQIL
ncbi:hypothetical protein ElyMa_003083300 [Elysia marginata]|uniref:Uncharacterized protein n=1 Tax=Elysia marginata TaxID=1093978 RepID=A0AAV4IS55_9GAST|nr:hypothetical protein ElyMa_003083300 [Elysia marginata]